MMLLNHNESHSHISTSNSIQEQIQEQGQQIVTRILRNPFYEVKRQPFLPAPPWQDNKRIQQTSNRGRGLVEVNWKGRFRRKKVVSLPSGPPRLSAVPDPMIRPVPTAPPSYTFINDVADIYSCKIKIKHTAIIEIWRALSPRCRLSSLRGSWRVSSYSWYSWVLLLAVLPWTFFSS